MKQIDLMEKASQAEIRKDLIELIETKYNKKFPENIERLISYIPESYFFDGWRLLTEKEILNASEYLNTDFISAGLLPIIDAYDNDFIVYDLNDNIWKIYNITDEVAFNQAENPSELLR